MEVITLYACSFCGHTFKTEEEARKHESTHRELLPGYEAVWSDDDPWPESVIIRAKGVVVSTIARRYKRVD